MALTHNDSISFAIKGNIGYVYSDGSKYGSDTPIATYPNCRNIDDVANRFYQYDKRTLCMSQEDMQKVRHNNDNVTTLIDELNKKYNMR